MAPKKKKVGRPTAFKPEYVRIAHSMALLGCTDVQLAAALGVSVVTVNNWKRSHPEFLSSLNEGKEMADAKVAQSLYRRALGYQHKAVKIFADPKTGAEKVVDYVERYPPDTTAAIFWLKNRKPVEWRDRRETDVTSNGETIRGVIALPPEVDP